MFLRKVSYNSIFVETRIITIRGVLKIDFFIGF